MQTAKFGQYGTEIGHRKCGTEIAEGAGECGAEPEQLDGGEAPVPSYPTLSIALPYLPALTCPISLRSAALPPLSAHSVPPTL
eukprot:193083-Rhodomonas_salina.2